MKPPTFSAAEQRNRVLSLTTEQVVTAKCVWTWLFNFPSRFFFVRETEVSAKIDDILNTLLHRTIATQSCAKWIVIIKAFIMFQMMLVSFWNMAKQSLHTEFIQKTSTKIIRNTKNVCLGQLENVQIWKDLICFPFVASNRKLHH